MSGDRSFWDELAYWVTPEAPRFHRVVPVKPIATVFGDIPVIVDPAMPPDYFELRSGDQRVGCWLDSHTNHDPGDEDRR